MEQQTPHPPKSRMKPREGQKRAIFPSLIWGEVGSGFSIYFVQDCNLGQNKMEQQTPHPPKSRMKPREGQKRAIFPSLIWGEGGSGFSIYFVQDCSLRRLTQRGVGFTRSLAGSNQHFSFIIKRVRKAQPHNYIDSTDAESGSGRNITC